jgi:hypothetical protein
MPAASPHVRTAVAATTAGLALVAMTGVASAATPARYTFGGHSYGSSIAIGSLVRSGPTAYVPLCTVRTGVANTDRTARSTPPRVGTLGAVATKVYTTKSGATKSARAASRTARTNLLGGLIQFTALTTTARQTVRDGHFTVGGNATFTGLRIAGRSYPATPAPDRTVTLPGIGTVRLNHHGHSSAHGVHTSAVTALQLNLTAGNTLGLGKGTVTIGRTVATVHNPTERRAFGSAFGSTVQRGDVVTSGRTAPVYLPCGGSNGTALTNDTAGLNVPVVGRIGAVTSSANSSDSAARTVANTRSRVAGVNLLGGVIRARAVTAEAHAKRSHGRLTTSSTGTEVLGLTINGTPIAQANATGTRTIPGIGTLQIGYHSRSGNAIQVYALRLVLSAAQGSLAKGTVINIGAARAGVRP